MQVLYENWTDRDGIYSVDPRLFDEKELEGKSLNIINEDELQRNKGAYVHGVRGV
jgi:aspartokinase